MYISTTERTDSHAKKTLINQKPHCQGSVESFYKKGYDGTTVEDIIALSKTSKGTFYHYFKGKEALLNSISDLFDSKYEELRSEIDPNLSAYNTLLYLNRELFHMIETSIDVNLIAFLYSSQLITKDHRSLLDENRLYFMWLREIISKAVESGEFSPDSSTDELLKLYAMYERSMIYDWALCKGTYSLSQYSSRLLPHMLDTFIHGI